MSTKKLVQIQKKAKKHQEMISQLLSMKKMVRGSFCLIHVKCGSKNCRCNKGKLHPHSRMSWNEKGRSFSRAVPKDEHDWVREMTDRFREFRKLRKEIVKLEKEMKNLFDEYEEEVVDKTRKGKSYLDVWND